MTPGGPSLQRKDEELAPVFGAGVLVDELDAEGRYVYASPPTARLMGRPRDELLGKSCLGLIHPEDRDYVVTSLTELASAPGRTHRAIFRVVRADGEVLWLESSAHSQRAPDDEGGGVRVVAVSLDVTERMRTERALSESEERFEKAFANSPSMMVITDLRGVWLGVNEAFVRNTGFSPGEVLGQRFAMGAPPPSEEERAALVEHLVRRGSMRHREWRYRRRAGEPGWALVSATRLHLEEGDVIVWQSVDITATKRAEQALRESEERFEKAFRAAPSLMLITDLEGTIIDANDTWLSLVDRPLDTARGSRLAELSLSVDAGQEARFWEQIRADGWVPQTEVELRDAAGRLHCLLVSGQRIRLGHAEHVVWQSIDVTDRKRVEEALRESEDTFQKVFRSAPSLMLITELDGTLVDANRAFSFLGGWSVEDARKLEDFGDRAWKDPKKRQRLRERVLRDGTIPPAEVAYRTREGEERYGLVSAVRVSLGGRERLLWQAVDVTERKRAQQELERHRERLEDLVEERTRALADSRDELTRQLAALQAGEERYRALAENAHDLIGEWAASGVLVYANPAWERVLGWTRQELLDTTHLASVVHPGDLAQGLERFREILETGRSYRHELRLRDRSGAWHRLDGNVTRFTTAEGEVRVMAILRDITDQRRLEEELERSERLASIGTLAAGIAHEINNPVASILLAAQYAQRHHGRDDGPSVTERALADVVENARRCGRIVKGVLHFSQQRPADLWPHDLRDVVRGGLDLVRREAERKAVCLDVRLPGGPVHVLMNPTQIEQVVVNVVHNALASGETCSRVRVTAESTGLTARLTVEDDGPGLDERDRRHVFDPFFTTRRERGGTGLGLSVSHGIVTQHGGTIDLQSEPGRGTTVVIELPLADPIAEHESDTRTGDLS